jgi:integrase
LLLYAHRLRGIGGSPRSKLRWLAKRGAYYITWTERGRSRERSTGTSDRAEAEIIFGEWLQTRGRKIGPGDPAKVLVTDALIAYATEHKVNAPRVIGCAISAMTPYWEGLTVADVTPLTCERYVEWRRRSVNTARRELAVLQAAINWGHKNAKLTRSVAVTLPAKPPSKDRWLTKREAALLLRASRTQRARLYLPLFILMGLYTGRRKEAILALRWPQVDLDRGVIDFRKPGEAETKKRRGGVRTPSTPTLTIIPTIRRVRQTRFASGVRLSAECARNVCMFASRSASRSHELKRKRTRKHGSHG